jgi:hypothetical protein
MDVILSEAGVKVVTTYPSDERTVAWPIAVELADEFLQQTERPDQVDAASARSRIRRDPVPPPNPALP